MPGLPILASEHGSTIDFLILAFHALMIVIFVGWSAFFLYALWRFRRKKNPKADYTGVTSHKSSYLEAAIAIIEIVLLVGIAIPFWATQIDAFPDPESDPMEVRVVAQQFAWNIHYPGPDGVFGVTRPELVDDQLNPIGLDESDPAAADDITTINNLHLPVDRPALIHLSSKDVIHSFALPELRVKQDAIPGMSIPVHFTPTMTSAELRERTGNEFRTFEIACAQLCGLTHYRMLGLLYVETQQEFDSWLQGRLDRKQQ